ncbi:hypothetical protein [Massilia varians]|uniref:hypothetical protein n=1 Tax=Massilia varians TaxID=457921 RepID=UPI002554BF56|nr:hypothetical protein [Massilia varians]MDK6080491.1 hypothetical protein [Massilia varians]
MNAKTTATELPKATNDQRLAALSATLATPQAGTVALPGGAGAIKNASTPISSTPPADATAKERKCDANASPTVKAEKKLKAITKMETASAIYLRMSTQKDITRKQIVEQFVAEAKLSPAGASTYYQLIKAKLG